MVDAAAALVAVAVADAVGDVASDDAVVTLDDVVVAVVGGMEYFRSVTDSLTPCGLDLDFGFVHDLDCDHDHYGDSWCWMRCLGASEGEGDDLMMMTLYQHPYPPWSNPSMDTSEACCPRVTGLRTKIITLR